ncbi:MAG: chitobiase/beta-hexosaminidase C-terminal domain-containing protein [Patescibacteria group bacterium]|nr:chitobiase/beta-hexosaminidase C-terminal domain-containing protein [Patescibacteria group bacterium]
MNIGALESLEQVIADSISADAFFAGVTVMVEPQKNIIAEVRLKTANIANVIVPYVPEATDDSSGIEGVFYDVVPFSISVFQNPKLVTQGPTARAYAERVAANIKGNPGWPRNVFLRKPTIVHAPDDLLNIYDVLAQTAVDGVVLPQLPAVTGAAAGGNVTLACAQPGAAIFYRTDGALPTTSDTLYTAPFAAAGVLVTARAWLQGFLASPWFKLQT